MSLGNPIRSFKLSTREKVNRAFRAFNKKERLTFAILSIIFVISALYLIQAMNRSFMVEVPLPGGAIREGIVGSPRFVNPVLASSPADQDMVALVYSGLMRKDGAGNVVPDLAEKYERTEDGLKYTFTLKDRIYFHNGTPVTIEDVLFTIDLVKNSVITSPQKVNWEGVVATKVNDKTIEFSLRQPYPDFLEAATLGIMPKALWENSPLELNEVNTSPIGSGPYKIISAEREREGIITSYKLAAFNKFALGEPYIREITLNFYQNEEEMVRAYEDGKIAQASSVTPALAAQIKEEGGRVESAILPRIFGLFFNQNQNPIFLDKTAVSAIAQAIDKERIVREVLKGFGAAIDSPIPASMAPAASTNQETTREDIVKKVQDNLTKNGWVVDADGFRNKTVTERGRKTATPLSFAISTGNAPELQKTAELIREDLSRVGIKVEIKTFEVGNLNQNVIRPRKYDALLFGQIVNHETDLFAFWHSSQRRDPGLNIALYTNARVDTLLETAFSTVSDEERFKKYAQFESEIKKDMPAVFLYSPNFIYAVSPELKGLTLNKLTNPSDRFNNVHQWFIQTENVWKVFSNID